MNNDLRDAAEVVTVSGLFAAFVSALSAVAQARGGWLAITRSVLAAMVVGGLTGLGLMETQFSIASKGAFIGLSAILGDYILSAVMLLGGLLAKDPLTFAERLWAAFRGLPAPKDKQP